MPTKLSAELYYLTPFSYISSNPVNNGGQLIIDLSERFPHLSRAPITEAVIEIRARGGVTWKEDDLLAKLKPKLEGYPQRQPVHARQFEVRLEKEPKVVIQDPGWLGFTFTSADGKQIAKFQSDLFSFSRLQPYESWDRFVSEALLLWEIHSKLLQPLEIQRLGVRFINRLPIPTQPVRVDSYFRGFPDDLPELNLVLGGFLHHDALTVPGQPYGINLIKTVQNLGTVGSEAAFILDIDVYSQHPIDAKTDLIESKLREMHWLKNKTFFGIITEHLKESLQ